MMNEKYKLRFLINTLSCGGAEKVLVDLLCKLTPDKYDISLVSISKGTHVVRIPEYVNYRAIIPFSNKTISNFFKRIVYKLPPTVFSFLFLRGKNDVEVAYLEGTPTRCVAAKKNNIKIAFVHCDFSKNNIVIPYYKSAENCFKEYASYKKVCFVSNSSKNGFEACVGMLNNSCVIHNVIDFGNIRNKMLETPTVDFNTSGIKLLTVGRLVKEKGYDRLLRIASKLEVDFDFELLIVGEGPERKNLEHIISENNIKSAKIVGFQNNPYAFMRKADIFVCSSYTEGYSTAVVESISTGLPVVTTECAGMDEIIGDGKFGVIVENNEEALYMELKRVFDDRTVLESLKEAAEKRGLEICSSDAVSEYTELFDSLINQQEK